MKILVVYFVSEQCCIKSYRLDPHVEKGTRDKACSTTLIFCNLFPLDNRENLEHLCVLLFTQLLSEGLYIRATFVESYTNSSVL